MKKKKKAEMIIGADGAEHEGTRAKGKTGRGKECSWNDIRGDGGKQIKRQGRERAEKLQI